MLKKSNNPHSPDCASGALTPSFGHLYAISKQEEGSTLPEPTLRNYLDQAENQSIKQSFTLGRKPNYFFGLHHCCELVEGGEPCSPLLTLDSQYMHLLSKGALANAGKSHWSYIDTTLKNGMLFGSLF